MAAARRASRAELARGRRHSSHRKRRRMDDPFEDIGAILAPRGRPQAALGRRERPPSGAAHIDELIEASQLSSWSSDDADERDEDRQDPAAKTTSVIELRNQDAADLISARLDTLSEVSENLSLQVEDDDLGVAPLTNDDRDRQDQYDEYQFEDDEQDRDEQDGRDKLAAAAPAASAPTSGARSGSPIDGLHFVSGEKLNLAPKEEPQPRSWNSSLKSTSSSQTKLYSTEARGSNHKSINGGGRNRHVDTEHLATSSGQDVDVDLKQQTRVLAEFCGDKFASLERKLDRILGEAKQNTMAKHEHKIGLQSARPQLDCGRPKGARCKVSNAASSHGQQAHCSRCCLLANRNSSLNSNLNSKDHEDASLVERRTVATTLIQLIGDAIALAQDRKLDDDDEGNKDTDRDDNSNLRSYRLDQSNARAKSAANKPVKLASRRQDETKHSTDEYDVLSDFHATKLDRMSLKFDELSLVDGLNPILLPSTATSLATNLHCLDSSWYCSHHNNNKFALFNAKANSLLCQVRLAIGQLGQN